jgi:DNA-binding response OmpR family regulator
MAGIFKGKRVLLVEDEGLIAMVVSDMLEEMGFAVVDHVMTLGAAMMSAKDRPPDSAILACM